MFNTVEFQKNIKAIADNVPDQFKSTLGGNIHWTISQAFVLHFQPRLEALEARIEELENGNEKRGLQESQGNEESQTKTARCRKE